MRKTEQFSSPPWLLHEINSVVNLDFHTEIVPFTIVSGKILSEKLNPSDTDETCYHIYGIKTDNPNYKTVKFFATYDDGKLRFCQETAEAAKNALFIFLKITPKSK